MLHSWIKDINIVVKYFFRIINENYSLYDAIIEGTLMRLLKTFEDYLNLSLIEIPHVDDNDCLVVIREKLLLWLKVEYHPNTIVEDVLNTFIMFKYNSVKNTNVHAKFLNWIEYCKILRQLINSNKTDLEEKENEEIINRFYIVLDHIDNFIQK